MSEPAQPTADTRDAERTMDEPSLVFEGVTRSFKVRKRTASALRSIDFECGSGKITALIGPDGSGKTTMMRLAEIGRAHV